LTPRPPQPPALADVAQPAPGHAGAHEHDAHVDRGADAGVQGAHEAPADAECVSRDGAEASRGQSPAGEVDDAASVTDEARLAKEGAAESGEQDGDNRKTESPDGGDGKGLEGAEEGAASGPSQDPQGMAQENGVCMYHTHVS